MFVVVGMPQVDKAKWSFLFRVFSHDIIIYSLTHNTNTSMFTAYLDKIGECRPNSSITVWTWTVIQEGSDLVPKPVSIQPGAVLVGKHLFLLFKCHMSPG